MKMKLILLMVFLGLIFSPLALADQTAQVCKFVPGAALTPVPGSDIPLRQTAYTVPIDIPKFDPALGVLERVFLDIDACGRQHYQADNEDPQPLSTFDVTHSGVIKVTVPIPVPEVVEVDVTDTSHFTLPADNDAAPDFVGTDSFDTTIEKCADAPANKVYDLPSDLASFTASGPGISEVMSLSVSASGSASTSADTGNFATLVSTSMGAKVCVMYEYQPPLCINGTKINGCTDAGIPGWLITLKDSNGAVIDSQQTDEAGDYSFCGLAPGTYQVCEETRNNWVSKDATCRDVTLVDVDQVVDFTNTPLSCISGHKFNQLNNQGLSGWTINLKDASGTVIKTTTTGTGGLYQFCGLVPGNSYTVCEVAKAGWKAVGATCIDVEALDCDSSVNNDFFNTPVTQVCVCPFFIKNDLYTASCHAVYEVDAAHGILANDPAGSIVLHPELITIPAQYGTITVEEDGSFVYDPTGATGLHTGTYVIFNYSANNGQCDSKYLGIAKIQVSCK